MQEAIGPAGIEPTDDIRPESFEEEIEKWQREGHSAVQKVRVIFADGTVAEYSSLKDALAANRERPEQVH